MSEEEKRADPRELDDEQVSIKLEGKDAEEASPEILNTSMMVDGKMDQSSVIIIEGPSTAMAQQQDVSSLLEPDISLLPEAKIDELPSSGKKQFINETPKVIKPATEPVRPMLAVRATEIAQRDSIDTIKMFDEFEQEDFDDDDMVDVQNSPPRRSVETLNSSERRRDASVMRKKRVQEQQ